MFSPSVCRVSSENRVLISLVGIIAGGAALLLTFHFSKNQSLEVSREEMPSIPRTGADGIREVPDSERFAEEAVKFCADEIKANRSFVVFRHGTCVLVPEPTDDPLAVALVTLREASDPGAIFATAIGADGSVMVTYRQKLFQRFTGERAERLRDWLEIHHGRLITDGERAAKSEDWKVPEATRIGLLGRWCLLRDAEEKKPVRIIRASQNHVTRR